MTSRWQLKGLSMDIHFTARRFKAHREVRDYALNALKKLDTYYDGIGRSDIILSYERKPRSLKTAEINLRLHGVTLSASEKSDEFTISIDRAIEKVGRQLGKMKSKLIKKDRGVVRKIKSSPGDEFESARE